MARIFPASHHFRANSLKPFAGRGGEKNDCIKKLNDMLQGRTPTDTNVRNVNSVADGDRQRIEDFLKEAVYCWCNDGSHKGQWFTAINLVGSVWNGTPLIAITNYYLRAGKPLPEAEEQAGKDLGMILKIVLKNDTQTFETEREDGGRWRRYKLK